MGHGRRSTTAALPAQRSPSVHRGAAAAIRAAWLSARKLKQAGTNLLAGRALRRVMFPLLPAEFGDDFDLAEVFASGACPLFGSRRRRGKPPRLRAIVLEGRSPGRGPGPQLAGVRPVPSHRRPFPCPSPQPRRTGARRGRGADDRPGLPRNPGGHAPGLAPARLRGQTAGQGTETPEAVLDRPRRRARRQARVPSAHRERTRRSLEGWVATLLRAYGEPDHGLGSATTPSSTGRRRKGRPRSISCCNAKSSSPSRSRPRRRWRPGTSPGSKRSANWPGSAAAAIVADWATALRHCRGHRSTASRRVRRGASGATNLIGAGAGFDQHWTLARPGLHARPLS